MEIVLRLLNSMEEIDVQNLPIVFTGNIDDARDYAQSEGFVWKTDNKLLFQGYFVNDNGECLVPDCIPTAVTAEMELMMAA